MKKHKAILVDYGAYPFLLHFAERQIKREAITYYLYNGSFKSPNSGSAKSKYQQGVEAVSLNNDAKIRKDSLLARLQDERTWARILVRRLNTLHPTIIIAANCPLVVVAALKKWCTDHQAQFIFWLQDLHGPAITAAVQGKIPVIGHIAAWWFNRLERRLIRQSDHVIAICDLFAAHAESCGLSASKISVQPNWAPIDEIPILQKKNSWSEKYGFHETVNFIYTGTLGHKHNPDLLIKTADHFANQTYGSSLSPRVHALIN